MVSLERRQMKLILLSVLAAGILVLGGCGQPAVETPAPATYTLSAGVSPSDGGSVSPASGVYEEGTEVTVTATPASDYTFDYWDGDASGSLATVTVTMYSDKSITAYFAMEAPPPPAITEEDIDAAWQVVLEYWEGRNSYDLERVLACYEESYRQDREEEVASEISQMQMARITIEVEEEAEPVITDEGIIELRVQLNLPFPIPARHIIYYMVKVDGEWEIGCPPEE